MQGCGGLNSSGSDRNKLRAVVKGSEPAVSTDTSNFLINLLKNDCSIELLVNEFVLRLQSLES